MRFKREKKKELLKKQEERKEKELSVAQKSELNESVQFKNVEQELN